MIFEIAFSSIILFCTNPKSKLHAFVSSAQLMAGLCPKDSLSTKPTAAAAASTSAAAAAATTTAAVCAY